MPQKVVSKQKVLLYISKIFDQMGNNQGTTFNDEMVNQFSRLSGLSEAQVTRVHFSFNEF